MGIIPMANQDGPPQPLDLRGTHWKLERWLTPLRLAGLAARLRGVTMCPWLAPTAIPLFCIAAIYEVTGRGRGWSEISDLSASLGVSHFAASHIDSV